MLQILKRALILPNCFPLISLKTVNGQRGRKVGELLWIANDGDSVGLVRSQAVSAPYLSQISLIAALLSICITVLQHNLWWTTKKLSLCILYLLCSNVRQTLFHEGSALSGAVCITSDGPQRNWVFVSYICFVQMSVKLFSMRARPYQGQCARFINRQKAPVILSAAWICCVTNIIL